MGLDLENIFQLIKPYCKAIYLGGSTLLGFINNTTDIDLICFTRDIDNSDFLVCKEQIQFQLDQYRKQHPEWVDHLYIERDLLNNKVKKDTNKITYDFIQIRSSRKEEMDYNLFYHRIMIKVVGEDIDFKADLINNEQDRMEYIEILRSTVEWLQKTDFPLNPKRWYQVYLGLCVIKNKSYSWTDEQKINAAILHDLKEETLGKRVSLQQEIIKDLEELKYKKSIILVGFSDKNNFACNKKCEWCYFNKKQYNITVKPTDEQVLQFLQNYSNQLGIVQICGVGDPLFEFKKNKSYLAHLISIIKETGRKIELVTSDLTTVEKYYDTELKDIDFWSLSVETKDIQVIQLIKNLISKNKKVRLTKIYNFTSNILTESKQFIEQYLEFYSKNIIDNNFSICLHPNYNFDYTDKDIKISKGRASWYANMYSLNIYLSEQNSKLKMPQLWGNTVVPCSDTYKKIDEDMKQI